MKMKLVVLGIILGLCAFAPSANAATITIDLGVVFLGDPAPSGVPPWLTATLADVAGGVDLTLTAANLTGSEFVSQWAFNFDPTRSPVAAFGVSGLASPIASVTWGSDCCKMDGDGYYDLVVNFNTAQSQDRFQQGDTVTFHLTGDIDVYDFLFPATGSNKSPLGDGFISAAHLQSLTGGQSTWVGDGATPVPEPASMLLLGTGLLGTGLMARRRRK
jgi:hypothetical protein